MKKSLLFFALLALCGSSGLAANPVSPSLLPNQAGHWTAASPVHVLKAGELGDRWAPGTTGERILKESGLKSVEERTYHGPDGDVTVRAYQLADPSRAYEVFTYLLTPGTQLLNDGATAMGPSQIIELVGNLVVESSLPPKATMGSVDDLTSALRAKADQTPLPALKDYLPVARRIPGSERYASGPEAFRAALDSTGQAAYADLVKVAGFESEAEASVAHYAAGKESAVLALISYPTPQLAEQHLHHLQEALPQAAKEAGVKVERKTTLLSIVFAATSKEFAQKLRDDVNYETQITWNESSHTATDPPIVVIMVKIFLFTGLFLGVATGLGVAFGGARVIIKRMFPGKVFDRPQDIEILQMGLSGKKIDPTDMY